jgi:hypothetical protein
MKVLFHQAELVVAVMEEHTLCRRLRLLLEPQIREAAVEAVVTAPVRQVAVPQAVQVLSFFVIQVIRNILLVVLLAHITDMLYTHLHLLAL